MSAPRLPLDLGPGLALRLRALVAELRVAEAVTVTRETLFEAVAPIDPDYEAELTDECADFALDPAMRAWWSQVDGIDFVWEAKHPGGRSTPPGGRLRLPDLLRLVRPSLGQDDVAVATESPVVTRSDGGPLVAADAAARTFLLQLHFLDCVEGDHWTAVRARQGQAPELWYRRGAELDMRLVGGFEAYAEVLLSSRGATSWPLLLVDVEALTRAQREQVVRYFVPQLEASLSVLARVPPAQVDAERLRAQLQQRWAQR